MSTYTIQIAHHWNGTLASPKSVSSIKVDCVDPSHITVTVHAPFHGDPAPETPPGSTWQLWEHEVVELFLVNEDGDYSEFEFGPHGHYLGLQLSGPRTIVRSDCTFDYRADIDQSTWTGFARIPRDLIPRHLRAFNAFAIFGCGEHRTYLCHHPLPGAQPDFHQPERFPSWPPRST